ncbi:MAG: four-carbon acid sugar kinase family protein [Planctomycetes bacterium]|nr:four-carbon acid sugar kinase family protein [Planctomycetota bacterium]
MRFAVIADDNTGATDAGGMLTQPGVRTALVLDTSRLKDIRPLRTFDAVVFGTQARSVSPRTAYYRTGRAVVFAQALRPKMVQIKYCSTFDSTPRGNIGPSLDAASDRLKARQVIVCPALPVNGRTTYMGCLFVNGQLLSESPLRNHPLNPMTDSNLVRWLSHQTRRKVGLADLNVIRGGERQLRKHLGELARQGIAYVITDAVDQGDIRIAIGAVRDSRLISGGSGITAEVPGVLFPGRKPLSFNRRLADMPKGTAVISGSLSPTTHGQKEYAIRHGFVEVPVDAVGAISGRIDAAGCIRRAGKALAAGRPVLIHSYAARPDETSRAAAAAGLDEVASGARIGKVLAGVAAALVAGGKIGRLVVSGGETSGAVCRELGFNVLEIGLPIDPGVPYCFPLDNPRLLLVLKSGNFGAKDLYEKVRRL